MRTTKIVLSGLAAAAACAVAAPALAADLGGGFAVNGSAAIVSDYRFRGISQTDRRPALQGGLTLSHRSGLYGTIWGSSIDDYVYNGADQELDFVAGYRRSFGGTTVDVGALYYHYPNSGGIDSDFVEPFASVAQTFGPLTAKATVNYAPSQSALSVGAGDEDNLYLGGDLILAVPATPLSLTAHVGHSWGPSYLTIGDEYTDWSVGASVTQGPLTAALSYVDTDGTFTTPRGRNAAGSGVVASLGVAF